MRVLVARLKWFSPALLLLIGILLIRAGFQQRATYESGTPATARVVDHEIRNRADVTYGHIDLMAYNPALQTFVSQNIAVQIENVLISRFEVQAVDVLRDQGKLRVHCLHL